MALGAIQPSPHKDSDLLGHIVIRLKLTGHIMGSGADRPLSSHPFDGDLVVGFIFLNAIANPRPIGMCLVRAETRRVKRHAKEI